MERKITIEEAEVYQEDYQMRMLWMNDIEGLLPVKGRGVDGASFYDYNVSGKISLQALYEKNKISGEDLKLFLRQLLGVMRETENYLLNIHCVLLQPEYIFYEDERFYFCYYPRAKQDVWEEFHRLTEYFVKQADYEDKECVRIVFILHKETMADNYSLEKIAKECMKEEKKEKPKRRIGERDNITIRKLYEEDEDEEDEKRVRERDFAEERCGALDLNTSGYDSEQHDWIKKQHHGKLIMEETENMWTPVKRFLNRRKKPKWGDWDGLYIEEEEL